MEGAFLLVNTPVPKRMDKLNELKSFILDRNNSLVEIADDMGMSIATLRGYRQFPEKLQTASWDRIELLIDYMEEHDSGKD